MPGLEPDTLIPTERPALDRKRHVLVLAYGHAGGEQRHELSFEFQACIRPRLRRTRPGPGSAAGWQACRPDITELEPVGMYAVRPTFSDGQQFRHLFMGLSAQAVQRAGNPLARYLARLERAGHIVTETAGNTDFADGTTHLAIRPSRARKKQRRCATCSIPSPANTTS